MAINNILNFIFTSPTVILVLRELNARKSGVTGREIARLSGITHRSALKALENLELLNLVKRQVAGRTYYFTLNREHHLYKKVLSNIFKTENEFLSEINKYITKYLGRYSLSIIIFGSAARGDEKIDSDLDVCFVFKNGRRNIEQLIPDLRTGLKTIYGITLAPFIISLSEFRKRAGTGKSPVNNILKEGKVIYGKQLRNILNE